MQSTETSVLLMTGGPAYSRQGCCLLAHLSEHLSTFIQANLLVLILVEFVEDVPTTYESALREKSAALHLGEQRRGHWMPLPDLSSHLFPFFEIAEAIVRGLSGSMGT